MAIALPRNELSPSGMAELNERFEKAPASEIISWAVDTFHPHLALTASMTDAVLIDLAVKVEPAIEVVFIDTGYHFPETLETVELVRRKYGLNLRMMTVPHHDEELWKVDPENCCSAIKVGQLDRALAGKEHVRRHYLTPRLLRDRLALFNRLAGRDTGTELEVIAA